VNVTKEIGKFYQNKTMEYSHWVLRKSNAKSMDIDMETNLLLLQSYTEAKEFEKAVKKAMDMVDVSSAALYYYSGLAYNQLAQFKSKRNVGNGTRLSCRRQRINDKLQHTTW
jgi:hypothetical protein